MRIQLGLAFVFTLAFLFITIQSDPDRGDICWHLCLGYCTRTDGSIDSTFCMPHCMSDCPDDKSLSNAADGSLFFCQLGCSLYQGTSRGSSKNKEQVRNCIKDCGIAMASNIRG